MISTAHDARLLASGLFGLDLGPTAFAKPLGGDGRSSSAVFGAIAREDASPALWDAPPA